MMNIAEMGYFFERESNDRIRFVAEQIRQLAMYEENRDMTFYDALVYVCNRDKVKLEPNEDKKIFDLIISERNEI